MKKPCVPRPPWAAFAEVTFLGSPMLAAAVRAGIDFEAPQLLEELRITSFDDYWKYLPGPSSQNGGPSHEQAVTTIRSNLEVHSYDIACVEELSGLQERLKLPCVYSWSSPRHDPKSVAL